MFSLQNLLDEVSGNNNIGRSTTKPKERYVAPECVVLPEPDPEPCQLEPVSTTVEEQQGYQGYQGYPCGSSCIAPQSEYKIMYVSGLTGPKGCTGPTGPDGPPYSSFLTRFDSGQLADPNPGTPPDYKNFSSTDFWTHPINLSPELYENWRELIAFPDTLEPDASIVLNRIGIYEISIDYEVISDTVHSGACADIKIFDTMGSEIIGRSSSAIKIISSSDNVFTDVKKWYYNNSTVGNKVFLKFIYAMKSGTTTITFSPLSATVTFSGFVKMVL